MYFLSFHSPTIFGLRWFQNFLDILFCRPLQSKSFSARISHKQQGKQLSALPATTYLFLCWCYPTTWYVLHSCPLLRLKRVNEWAYNIFYRSFSSFVSSGQCMTVSRPERSLSIFCFLSKEIFFRDLTSSTIICNLHRNSRRPFHYFVPLLCPTSYKACSTCPRLLY